MFILDNSLGKLGLPSAQVLKLYRSMRDVQLALPGQPSQEASAYLCQFRTDEAVATVAAFHLERSRKLAFYRSDPQEVDARKASAMLEKGLDFVESMGFLLTDTDIDLMEESDRDMLWTSLPIFNGSGNDAEDPPAEKKENLNVSQKKPIDASVAAKNLIPTSKEPADAGNPKAVTPSDASPNSDQGAVDELLAAVASLRTGRSEPSRRVRKEPSPEELRQRSQHLKENLGRILASL